MNKVADSVLDRTIEKAECVAEYDDAHEETRECSAEQKQLVLFLKELKARREAWEKLTAALAKVADHYSGDTDTHRETLSLLSVAERLEKEFSRYQNVEGNKSA